MSYYTGISLEIEEGNVDDDIEQIFLDEYNDGSGEVSDYGEEIREQLKEFSKKYPEVVFEMVGNGDASDDIWNFYVKNGKGFLAGAEIVYESYDESKLSEE